MKTYSIIIFTVKYLFCLILIIDLIRGKKTETLAKAITITFFAFSIIVTLNLFFSFTNFLYHDPANLPFYQINFIDYIFIVLIINKFFIKKK
jgi:hypothetical protein